MPTDMRSFNTEKNLPTVADPQWLVDRCCYPHFAYRGPRFNPNEGHSVLSELEEQLVEALKEAQSALLCAGIDRPAGIEQALSAAYMVGR